MIKIVPVFGGRVNSRDPSTLGEGELVLATDAYYKPNHPGLWKVPGNTKFNTTALTTDPIGLFYTEWDGADAAELWAFASGGTAFQKATAGLTGTFAAATIVSGGITINSSTTLTTDVVHYNNQHFVLTGETALLKSGVSVTGQNLWIESPTDRTHTVQLHGMLENNLANTVTSTGVGTGFTLSSGSTVGYWLEEVSISNTGAEKKSPSTPDTVITLTGTGALVKPVFTIISPYKVNIETTPTAYRVYATATNGEFPNGFLIGTILTPPINTTVEDTRTGTDPGAPTGVAYDKVTVSIAGITSSISKWATPPAATTGDVFKESLVTNDAANPAYVRYSFPAEPHAFPELNLIRFNTKIHDEVVLIRTVGDVVIVCLESSAWRIMDLPRPEDSLFAVEDVKEIIGGAFGCVGPRAGTAFQSAGGHRLAYVSLYGIVVTDGYVWDTITDDADWEATVDVSQLDQSVLVDNPRKWRLEFYYTPKADAGALQATRNTECMYLHYHKSHAKDVQDTDDPTRENFRLKCTWPVHVEAITAVVGKVSGAHEVFAGNDDGHIYVQAQGNSDTAADGGINFACRTAEIALAGPGNHARVTRFWTHHSAGEDEQTATVRNIARREAADDFETEGTISLERRESTSSYKETFGDSHMFACENSDSSGTFSVDYFVVDFESEGGTEEG
jgi:hypothetical protein